MTQIVIDIGAAPNDGTGDPLRTAFNDVNLNFANVFAAGPVDSNVRIANNVILTTNTNGNLVLNPNGVGVVQANAHVVPDQNRIRNLGSQSRLWDTTYTQYLQTTYANIGTANIANIGVITIPVANLHILGGSNGYVLQTDGTGNLTWTAQTGGSGNGVPSGANTQIQYNNAGSFGASVGFTFNRTSNALSVPGNVTAQGNISGNIIAPGYNQDVVFNKNGVLGTTSAGGFNFDDGSRTLYVYRGSFNGDGDTGAEGLYAGVASYTVLGSNIMAQFTGNTNSYSQVNLQNINDGADASGDYIITADNGDDATYYVDLGMAGSNHADPDFFGDTSTANDGYLYVTGADETGPGGVGPGNLILGSTNGVIKMFVGNTAQANVVATVDLNGLNVNIGNLTVPGNIQTITTGFAFTSNIANIDLSTLPAVYVELVDTEFNNTVSGQVTISGVVGTTEANSTWYFEAVDASFIQLYNDAGLTSPVDGTGWTAYASGGVAVAPGYNNLSITGGNVSITTNPSGFSQVSNVWTFTDTGSTVFPTLTTQRGDNPSGTISGQTLLFGDATQEAIISTTDGNPTDGINSQRLVINPGEGYDSGEGGDIYLWAGRGGDNNGSGGDVKIRGGFAPADGTGGYIRIDGGASQANGDPGFIEITGGQGGTTSGGYVQITGGVGGSGIGGSVDIIGGFGQAGPGADVTITGGGSANGLAEYGNVNIAAGASTWSFRNNGTTQFPNDTIQTANNQSLTIRTPSSGNAYTTMYQSSGHWEAYAEDDETGADSAWAWIFAELPTIDTPQVFIENKTGSDGISNRWTFDAVGNLTLPRGGVVYETNIPFGGLTGNTIALKPQGGSNADQQLLVYPTAGNVDANHLHLTSGNLYNTELFLGSDDLYVKLANTGDVVINSNDGTGNTAQWTFDTTGTIVNSGNLTLQTPSGIPATAAITGSSGSWESNPSSNLATTGGTGTGLTVDVSNEGGYASTIAIHTPGTGYTNGDSISVVSGSSSATFTISVLANGWTLDTAGNLTVAGSIIMPPNSVLTGASASPAPTIRGFGSISGLELVTVSGRINSGTTTVVNDGINSIALAPGAQMDVFGFPFGGAGDRGQLTISGITSTTEANGTWYYESTSTLAYQLYTDATYSTLVDASAWTPYTGGGSVAITKHSNAANVIIDSNGYFLKFDNTGNVALPNNVSVAGGAINLTGEGLIRSNNDTVTIESYDTAEELGYGFYIGTTGGMYFKQGVDPNWLTIIPSSGYADIATTQTLRLTAGTGTAGAAGKNLTITAGAADQSDYYTTAGGNVNITGGLGATNDGGGGGQGGSVNVYAGNSADPAGHHGNVVINTGGANTWTFDYTGTLTAPGNISAGNFVGAGSNVDIVAGSYSTVFDNTGRATFPGNVSVVGNVITPNLPAFRVYGNGVMTGLNVTTNGTGILNGNNWAVDYNQGSYLNSTTGVFTAPVAGLYQVNLIARCANNAAPSSQAIVYKNYGSANAVQVMWEVSANTTVNHFGVSTVSKLAVNDTLTLKATVGNITFDVNDSYSVAFLG